MSLAPIFPARIDQHGSLLLDQKADFREYLRKRAGQLVEVIVRKRRSKRSLEQNGYYWCVVIAMSAEYYGYEADEMHEAWKLHFLRLEDPDHKLPTVRSTTSLSTVEMEEYQERIRRKTLEDFGAIIPLPNEVEP